MKKWNLLGYKIEIHNVNKGFNTLPDEELVWVGFDGIIVRVFDRKGNMIYNKHRRSIWRRK